MSLSQVLGVRALHTNFGEQNTKHKIKTFKVVQGFKKSKIKSLPAPVSLCVKGANKSMTSLSCEDEVK